jgi:hypothetical protein
VLPALDLNPPTLAGGRLVKESKNKWLQGYKAFYSNHSFKKTKHGVISTTSILGLTY